MSQQLTIPENDLPEEMKALIAAAASEASQAETSGIPFLSTKGKKFASGDIKLGTELDVCILSYVYDHAYYDAPYDPDVIAAPACFAIGEDEATMEPSPSSPVIQSDTCVDCLQNQFGSAPNGKGKACRNGRRIIIAPVTERGVDLKELAIINISPTALKGFSKYIKTLATISKLPAFAVCTTISFDEDQAYPVVTFNFKKVLSSNDITDISQRLLEFRDFVSVPYNVESYEPPTDKVTATKTKSKIS